MGPLLFWPAWNVLDLAAAVGLPELGFWGIVLATLFLIVGWFPKLVITAIVFLADPSRCSPSLRRDPTRMLTSSAAATSPDA